MPYILFIIGVTALSVCGTLFASMLPFSKGVMLSLPLVAVCACFSANKLTDAAMILPTASVCFILGFLIPIFIIIGKSRLCDTREKARFALTLLSTLVLVLSSFFGFNRVFAAIEGLLLISYVTFTSSRPKKQNSKDLKITIPTIVFSVIGIAVSCGIITENAVLISCAGFSQSFIIAVFIVIFTAFAYIFSETPFSATTLFDTAEGLLALSFIAVLCTKRAILLIPKIVRCYTLPFIMAEALAITVTALFFKKHTAAFGVILMSAYIVFKILSVLLF